MPLIVVGSAPYADEYTRKVHALADDRARFLGGVWDQELLDQLYANSFTYLHGHSVGGTNPSLLRALGAGAATTAFDVIFNREVLGESGLYFAGADDVARLVEQSEADVEGTRARGQQSAERASLYDWDDVADRYEALCRRLVAQRSGRRVKAGGNSPANPPANSVANSVANSAGDSQVTVPASYGVSTRKQSAVRIIDRLRRGSSVSSKRVEMYAVTGGHS